MISYLQAVVIGLLQGVTELFPVSSLGHSVLVQVFIGGSWETLVTQSAISTSESSPYLAIIVALHVATAMALIVFFRSDWVRIIRGFGRTIGPSIAARRIVATDADERLAWLLVVATIPVGVTGLALEHTFRTLFAKPLAAAIFLTINGLILLAGEGLRRRAPADAHNGDDTQSAPAPQHVGGEESPGCVRRTGLPGSGILGQCHPGHRLPAMDGGRRRIGGVALSGPAQNVSGQNCGGCQDPGASASSAGDGQGEGIFPGVQDGDRVGEKVPVRVAGGAPGAPATGLVGLTGHIRVGCAAHPGQTRPG